MLSTALSQTTIHKGVQRALWQLASKSPAGLASPILSRLLNRALRTPIKNGELNFLQRRCLQLQITDLDRTLNIELNDDQLASTLDGRPGDVTFKGPVASFVALALKRQDPDTLFFNRQLSISGDTELGLEIKNLIDRLDLNETLDPPVLLGLKGLEMLTQRSNTKDARTG